MNKQKIIKTAVDFLAILLCCALAHLVAYNVKFLAKAETILAVCMGIYVYVPLSSKLQKLKEKHVIAEKIKKIKESK